jgi:hypothetical protein
VHLHVESVDVRSVQVDPNTVNPNSQGHWIHAFVELPEGDAPDEIILETVLAQNLVPVQPNGYSVGDVDADGVVDVRFRFDRKTLLHAFPPQDQVEVVISGEIRDRHYFVARDTVRVLRPHLLAPNGGERLLAGTFQSVRWEADEVDNPDSILVHYSSDGGASWTLIAFSEGNGPLTWHVPLEPAAPRLIVENGAFAAIRKTSTTMTAGAMTTIFNAMVLFIFSDSVWRTRNSVIGPGPPSSAAGNSSDRETLPQGFCDVPRDATRQGRRLQEWR